MSDIKNTKSFEIQKTTVISGKIFARNEDKAESDFHNDIVGILKSHGYTAKIVSNLEIPNRTKLDLHIKALHLRSNMKENQGAGWTILGNS